MSAPKRSADDLNWDEIGFLCEGMSFASRPFRLATQEITERYSLGPRGAWILVLIANGAGYPLDIAEIFGVGRSLVTAELARLTAAELITSQQSAKDGRRMELALTPLGSATLRDIRQGISSLVTGRLAAYSHDELMLCARMLRDWYGKTPVGR